MTKPLSDMEALGRWFERRTGHKIRDTMGRPMVTFFALGADGTSTYCIGLTDAELRARWLKFLANEAEKRVSK